MSPYQPIPSFDYFINKVCTIHTRQINWSLDPQQNIDYFVGIVNSVNECGICLTNVINHKKTFIMMPAVVAIAEETVMDGSKEDYETSSKEYDQKKQEIFGKNPKIIAESIPQPQPAAPRPINRVENNPFVDLSKMTAHVKAARDRSKK